MRERGPEGGLMKGRRGGPRSKPHHSSLHSYLGKEGFALPGRDGGRRGRRDEQNRRTTERGAGVNDAGGDWG